MLPVLSSRHVVAGCACGKVQAVDWHKVPVVQRTGLYAGGTRRDLPYWVIVKATPGEKRPAGDYIVAL
jgi:hypothetical protein